ncbi:NUDIX domain-containing protein [Methylobacterium trifolii]|uniref:GDP-mannose pyrophosphatase n=1 Tax=Methylobacterium trifolii TaxID=1003092 RepID=A0ABQ4U3M1_9HYPH|nr:NUDIX hydrolase [Methylobacterium trifolii]GJE60425.1 GDP-mannose pyrophosphatase NudK [Methylobacterium trifolii]
MAPIIRGTRLVHDGWARFLVAEVTMPDGTRMTREIEDHGRAVSVLPYDPGRRVAMLVSQFRAPVFFAGGPETLLETPAGILDEGDAEDGARREAYEETGLRLGALEPVVSAWTAPGISTERMDLFLAAFSEADRAGPGGGLAEEHEAITVHEMPLSEIAAMSDAGAITDMKTLVLVLALRLRHPDLFRGA